MNNGVWQRFKQNKPGLFGLWFIILSCFVAVFAFLLVPDKTPKANTQDLKLSILPPFSKIQGFYLDGNAERDPFLKRTFLGSDNTKTFLPIDSAWQSSLGWNFFPYGSTEFDTIQSIENAELGSKFFLIGTDNLGRDLYSRIVVGLRASLLIGLVAVFISLIIGVFLGAIAAYYGGWVDQVVMYLVNVLWSIPSLMLVLAMSLVFGKGFWQIFLAVGLTMWVDVARIVRGQVLSIKQMEYIEAARALGFNDFRILLKHILPNCMGPVIILSASNFATAILIESGLSFLGVGIQPPTPSLGGLIRENYPFLVMGSAYLALAPGIVIALLVFAFNLVGNALSDAFNSRLKID